MSGRTLVPLPAAKIMAFMVYFRFNFLFAEYKFEILNNDDAEKWPRGNGAKCAKKSG